MASMTNVPGSGGGDPRVPEVLSTGPKGAAPGAASRGRRFLAGLGVVASVLYLLNLDFGVIEALPDNIPFLGNVDEAGMTLLLISCLKVLRRR